MKHKFFNPALVTTSLPIIHSRRFRGTSNSRSAAYKTGGQEGDDYEDADEAEEPAPAPAGGAKPEDQLIEKIQTRMNKALKAAGATKKEMEAMMATFKEEVTGADPLQIRAMADEKTGAMANIAKQGLQIRRLEEQAASRPQDMSVRAQVQRWADANKESIKQTISSPGTVIPAPLEIRAATSPMLPSNMYGVGNTFLPSQVDWQAGVNDFIRPEPTFWDFIKKGRTNSANFGWVNKVNSQGEAAWLAPGVYKPNVSFELEVETSNVKKIADSAKMATELLQDLEGMVDFVETELEWKVFDKINTTMLGAGAATSILPAGIRYYAVPFATTLGLKTTTPNNYDVIRAMAAQIQLNFKRYRLVAFINPIDEANMEMTKAISQGQPFNAKSTGVSAIISTPSIPQGSVMVAAIDLYKVLVYKPFTIAWGWENDDFTKNLLTAIGEMRLHQFVSQSHTGFVVYDTFAAVKTSLAAA